MDSAYASAKKKKQPRKNAIPDSLLEEAKRTQDILRQYIRVGQLRKPPQFFEFYDVNSLSEIWDNFNEIQKLRILSLIKVKCLKSGENIYAFRPKKQVKQVFILLKGTLAYRINTENSKQKIEYYFRPGQILCPPFIETQLQFKPFFLVATSPCFVLEFPFDSFLRQNLWKKRQVRIKQLLSTLQNYNQTKIEQVQFSKLVPYFSECSYRKNQVILSQIKTEYLCYISEGEIEMVKESEKTKPISLISMGAGQIYIRASDLAQNDKNFIKCKSLTCLLYVIPQFFINYLSSPEFGELLTKKNCASQSFHVRLFNKNQRILRDPLNFIKEKTKKKVKSWHKRKSHSRKLAQSWDLIEHMANQMKKPKRLSLLKGEKQYSKSVHVTKRANYTSQSVSSLEKLKKMPEQQLHPEIPQQNLSLTNSFKPKLKNNLQKQSKLLKQIPRTFTTHVEKQSHNKLIKKTKYKLLRYAQGHNLYGLNDYL